MAELLEPRTERELAAILCEANQTGRAVMPRGGGTKLEWGNPPARADLTLSTARLNRVIEHAGGDLTVTVEAGCTVAELQRTLALHGQRLAADPLWPEQATVGGILSTNDTGALRLRYGGLRDLIIGVTLALADGTLAKSGGKVVKNVAGYDLPKLATGALGTLGVITRAVFRLHPLPQNAKTLTIAARDAADAQRILDGVQNSQLTHSALQARVSGGAPPQVDVLLEGTEAGIAAQENAIRQLVEPAAVAQAAGDVWSARERLWQRPGPMVKFSVLPAEIGKTIAGMREVVVQATGIGWARLEELRGSIEWRVVVRGGKGRDAWGGAGDSLAIMRALKQQFDPLGTLNPGRFVGGV